MEVDIVHELSMLKWVVILIPFFVGVYHFKKLNKAYKYLLFFVGSGTLVQIVNYVLIKAAFKNTMFLSYVYFPMAFLFLGLFYKKVFKGFIRSRIFDVLIASFFLFSLINVLFFQQIGEFASWPGSIVNITFLLASIVFFYRCMVETKNIPLWSEPLIWINSAVLLYYAGGLSSSLLMNLALDYSMDFAKLVSDGFSVLNAIFYTLLTVGFVKFVKAQET